MTITQDIPIQIISPSQLAAFTEPTLPDPEVYIMMPGLKSLKSVIERMKNIDEFLVIQANMAGELTFKVFWE
jgi:HUS1 checkpoint protein